MDKMGSEEIFLITFPYSFFMDMQKNPAKCQRILMKNAIEIIKILQ